MSSKQLDVYLRDLDVTDTIYVGDETRNGEESWDELMLDSPDVDDLIDLARLYQ